jgi:hypothetical protein
MQRWKGFCAAIVAGTITTSASASLIAYDDASDPAYADGWTSGDNGGTGWGGGWSFRNGANTQLFPPDANSSFYGTFVNTSLGNNNPAGVSGDSNTDGDIDTVGDEAWGLYANTSNEIYAVRPFSGALTVGQSLSFEFDNGNVTTGGVVGVRLVSNVNAPASSREFEFRFVGGDSFYNHTNGGAFATSTHGFSREGMRVEFTLTGTNTYSLKATRLQDGTIYNFNGTTQVGNAITGIALRNQNAGSGGANNGYFNSIAIPEPSSLCLTVLGAVGALRRRRTIAEPLLVAF